MDKKDKNKKKIRKKIIVRKGVGGASIKAVVTRIPHNAWLVVSGIMLLHA